MPKNFTRRELLTGMVHSSSVETEPTITKPKSPNERLQIGAIGVGGKGWSGMQWAAEYGDIVAVCDVDTNNRTKAMQAHPNAVSFEDYRKLIEVYGKFMDAVVISTPDHHHFVASSLAMKAGLHCYCEKPLTRTIWEARKLGELASRNKVATQMGNQSTASNPMRKMAAHISAGTFGNVKEVHLWTDRAGGWWKQGIERANPVPTPNNINFYLWLGPRPDRDYTPGYHPFAWRGWWDFGTGSLGDMGCHIFNMPHMALDLRNPTSVKAQTSGHNRDSFPNWAIVEYEFPKRGSRPGFKLTWYDGGKKPDPSLVPGHTYGGNGVIVVCENDTIYSPNSENVEFIPLKGTEVGEIEYDQSPGHMAEFAQAAMGGKMPKGHFPTYASPLTETVLLGNLAIWADGSKLDWDAKDMKVKGTHEFDELIKPEFRKGWEG